MSVHFRFCNMILMAVKMVCVCNVYVCIGILLLQRALNFWDLLPRSRLISGYYFTVILASLFLTTSLSVSSQGGLMWPEFNKGRRIWQKAEWLWQVHPTSHLYSPSGSNSQHRTDILSVEHVWAAGKDLISNLRAPHPMQYVIGPHKCTCQLVSKSIEWFKHGAQM